jgi:hypothetical protein
MTQTANCWYLDDFTGGLGLYSSRFRGVFAQRQVILQ